MAAALSALPRAAAVRLAPRGRNAPRLLCAGAAGEASPPSPAPRRLVLYSKPGCCLCDGLKEKLHAAFLLAGTPYSLASLELQERDITTDPEWERLYQYEIPVLAKVLPDGTEEKLPRLSPRLSVELIQKKISTVFDQHGFVEFKLKLETFSIVDVPHVCLLQCTCKLDLHLFKIFPYLMNAHVKCDVENRLYVSTSGIIVWKCDKFMVIPPGNPSISKQNGSPKTDGVRDRFSC